mmetsp:Transcript_66639/g.214712  ORF Transcript_66639/g.214712 Transcript_66639/m.214712 type:complete len:233 (-) Transcript_66639:625-1323(-)
MRWIVLCSMSRESLSLSSISSSSCSSIWDCTSASILLRTRKNGTLHFRNSSTNINSASVKREAVMSTTKSKCRMPISRRYVACGKRGVPTPGKSHKAHSAKRPVTWSKLTVCTVPSSSCTSNLLRSTLDITWASAPSSSWEMPRSCNRSPGWMGSSSGRCQRSSLPTPAKAFRNTPVRPGQKVNISGFVVVSVTPVLAAPGLLGFILRTALIQDDLPTPDAPVTAIRARFWE